MKYIYGIQILTFLLQQMHQLFEVGRNIDFKINLTDSTLIRKKILKVLIFQFLLLEELCEGKVSK